MDARFSAARCAAVFFVAAACVTLATSAAPSFAGTGTIAASSYAHLHWRLIGPFRGGRVLAVSGVRGNPQLFYFGAVDGGVWKSDDAGRTWNPIFDSEPIGSIGALAVAASDPKIIYAGSGEADMRSDISYGNGMYKSVDAGKTWTHIGLDDSRHIGRIVIDPRNPNRVFVAALGHAYAPSAQRGVYRSLDGGATWQRVLFVNDDTGAIDLAMDPADHDHLLAALWQTRRPPWNIYQPSNGPGSGLYESKDGGRTWRHLTGHGLPSAGLGRMGIAFSPSDKKRIYLIADAKQGGLYRSDDGARTWRRINGDERLWNRGWYFSTVTADPENADVVYVSDEALYRSTNAGATFDAIKGSPDGDDFHALWLDPSNPTHMILGCDQGASVSLNYGRTWSSWYNQPTGQFYHVATDNNYPFALYGSQQDSGAAMALSRSAYDSLTFRDWRAVTVGGESGELAPDPLDGNIVYGGSVDRYDLRTSQDQLIDPTLGYPLVQWRNTWTLPIVFSPADHRSLYFGRQELFVTTNGGRTWRIISPDLSRPNPGVPPNVDPATAADNQGTGPRRGVIYTIAPSPLRPNEIWAGTDDGKIWLTSDGGAHWRDVTPPLVGPWSKVAMLDASWFDPQEAYAAVDRHRLDDQTPYIYRTRDGGASWQLIASGIPGGSYVNAVRADSQARGLLFAGTETGPYVSFDDGDSWLPLQLNLPRVSVRDFSVRGDSLAIATHGRGFWVLDDLAPLRQLASIGAETAWLFTPAAAIRVRPGDDQGERLPPDEPAAPNPPDGAVIDYDLSAAPSTAVLLQIVDGSGRIVRQWSSADHVHAPNPANFPFPPWYLHTTTKPATLLGVNQFVWDLHYAAVPGSTGTAGASTQGPWAPPGRYTVRMTVNGQTFERPLQVVRDPRVTVSDADLRAQFAFAWSIEEEEARGWAAYQGAKKSIATLRSVKHPTAACSASRAAVAIVQLSEIAGTAPPVNPDNSMGYPEGDLSSLHALTGQLESLETATESADNAPTPDQLHAFAVIRALLDPQISRVTRVSCV